jgi:hypothetical protein
MMVIPTGHVGCCRASGRVTDRQPAPSEIDGSATVEDREHGLAGA